MPVDFLTIEQTESYGSWEVSPRQMSRIAAAGKQRDIDAVNGLPVKPKD